MNIELLQQLCEASAVSGDEQEVRDILINTLEPCVNEITFDGLGSFVARKGNNRCSGIYGILYQFLYNRRRTGFFANNASSAIFAPASGTPVASTITSFQSE